MRAAIKNILFGDTVITDYSKITVPGSIHEKVLLERNGHFVDVSNNQWILCIDPMVFGVWLHNDPLPADAANKGSWRLHFSDGNSGKAVAVASVELTGSVEEKEGRLLLLTLRKTSIRHIDAIRINLLFSRYYKKNWKQFDRFSAFATAYSSPRRIRLVSFRQNGYYNLFPMDLLGPTSNGNRYVFGLRHANTTLQRILDAGTVAVAEVPYAQKDAVYALSKHHSSAPPSPASLPFRVNEAGSQGFYIPEWAHSFREIKIEKTMSLGSHMLIWGVPAAETMLGGEAKHPYLIHFLQYFRQKRNGSAYPLI